MNIKSTALGVVAGVALATPLSAAFSATADTCDPNTSATGCDPNTVTNPPLGLHRPPAKTLHFMVDSCDQEDSPNCYWDAQVAGNHRGHSFYSIRIGNKDCVRYWNWKYNIKHGRCYPR